MKRIFVFTSVVVCSMGFFAGSAVAQTPAEDAVAGAEGGLYVAPNAETVDREAVAQAISDAAGSMDLLVVVLGDDVDAVDFADQVRGLRAGTVLVFTPVAYGASSTELDQTDLDDALDAAHGELSGPDIAVGVRSFVAATDSSGLNWLLVGLGVVVLLGAVAVVGRSWEGRASTGRKTDALQRDWDGLREKAGELSDPVIELSTLVELAERREVSEEFQRAASAYGDVRDRLDAEPLAADVEGLRTKLANIETSLEKVLDMVSPGSSA